MHQISIIIVNYNTEKVLKNCLLSVIEKTKDITYEIIVVDNNSKQASLDELIREFPSVNFCLLEQNLGFGRANNVGAKIASGNNLLFLNPDTILINNAVKICSDYLDAHPECGICGGNLYREDMRPTSSFYRLCFLNLEYRIIWNRRWNLGFNYGHTPMEVNVIVGADLCIGNSLFSNLGGFDDDFFMYFEEVELCNRAQRMGHKIMSIPDAQIIHLQGGAAENKNDELKKWAYKEHWYSKLVYFHKTKGKGITQRIYRLHSLKMQLALVAYSLKRNKNKLDYWRTKQQILEEIYSRYKDYLNLHSIK